MLRQAVNNPREVSVVIAMAVVATDAVMVAVAMAEIIRKGVKRARPVAVSRHLPSVMTFHQLRAEAVVVVANRKRDVSPRKFVNHGRRVNRASHGRREMTSPKRKAPSRQHRLLGLMRWLMATREIAGEVGVVVAEAVASGVMRHSRPVLLRR